jgi:DNA-binding transcriptional LysR family regulator
LADRAPQVNVKVSHIPEHDEQAVMASGDIDLAVGFFPELKTGFFQQRLYGDEFVCLLAASHAPKKGPISLKQFIEMRHALISTPGTGHEITVSRVIARHGLRVALTIPHFLAIPYIVSQSDLIVIVPRRLASTFLNYPGIAIVAMPVKIPPFEIKQYWHERYHNDSGNRWMRALVAELFLEMDSHFNHTRPSVSP